MVDIALVIVGLWLLFTIVHGELRRRENELVRERHRARIETVRERARALEVELEGLAGPASDPLIAGLPSDPTAAQIAAAVSPSPAEPGPKLLSEVKEAARARPDLAATALRRMLGPEREREPEEETA